jgi:hypothetical protein
VPSNHPKGRNRKNGLPTYINEEFWSKLQLLADHIRETFRRVYTSGTDITINKYIVPFRGRSVHTTKLKYKSIKEGFKIIPKKSQLSINFYTNLYAKVLTAK